MYIDGPGVAHDDRLAATWFERAAVQGDTTGQLLFGLACMGGQGVPKDTVAAFKWLSLSQARKTPPDAAIADTLKKLQAEMPPAELAEATRQIAAWRPVPAALPYK